MAGKTISMADFKLAILLKKEGASNREIVGVKSLYFNKELIQHLSSTFYTKVVAFSIQSAVKAICDELLKKLVVAFKAPGLKRAYGDARTPLEGWGGN